MQERARQIVLEYVNNTLDRSSDFQITEDDVYVVWFCRTLQNWKCLVSTTISDGQYYEVTYNDDKNETYLDVYKRWDNKCI